MWPSHIHKRPILPTVPKHNLPVASDIHLAIKIIFYKIMPDFRNDLCVNECVQPFHKILVMIKSLLLNNVWCNALCLLHINSHESRFNLLGILTNSTQRVCLVARGGREFVTFRSQSPMFSLYTTHVHKCMYCIYIFFCYLVIYLQLLAYRFDNSRHRLSYLCLQLAQIYRKRSMDGIVYTVL